MRTIYNAIILLVFFYLTTEGNKRRKQWRKWELDGSPFWNTLRLCRKHKGMIVTLGGIK